MAWEERGNNKYYYRKKKIDGRVISEYVGRGVRAQKIALIDLTMRKDRKEERRNIRQQKEKFCLFNNQVIQMSSLVNQMVGGFLIISGFHKHKGQWRRKRC